MPNPIFVFERNGLLITSNTSRMPTLPQRVFDHWGWGRRIDIPTWITYNHPFLAFVPHRDALRGPLFGPLAFPSSDPPIIYHSGETVEDDRWSLDPEACEIWQTLDHGLTFVISALAQYAGLFHTDFHITPPVANSMGVGITFHTRHKSVAAVKRAVERSRMALLARIALVSMIVSRMQTIPNLQVSWTQTLLQAGVPPAWVDYLSDSEAIVPQRPQTRVGAFLLPSAPVSRYPMYTMERGDVPFWLVWARVNEDGHLVDDRANEEPRREPGTFKRYAPTPEAAKMASEHKKGARISKYGVLEPIGSHEADSPADTPEPFPGSGQRRGQTWQQFFDERERKNELRVQSETSCMQKQRLERAAAHRPDDHPRHNVWEWIDYYCDGRYWIRMPVSVSDIPQVWSTFRPDQRLYDEFSESWDLCRFVGDTLAEEQDHYSVSHDDAFERPSDFSEPLHPLSLTDTQEPPVWNALSKWLTSSVHQLTTYSLEDESVDKFLYFKFGFLSCEQYYEAHQFESVRKDGDQDWNRFMSRLGMREVAENTMDSLRPILQDFLAALCAAYDVKGTNLTLPPNYMWDMHENSLHAFSLHDSLLTFEISYRSDVPMYHLNSKEADVGFPWSLVLDKASTVVLIVRRKWGPSLKDIALQLVERNLAFSLAISKDHSPPITRRPTTLPHAKGFSMRPFNWEPKELDYAEYVHRRHALLSNSSCARAAVLKGGILGRLARTYFDLDRENIFNTEENRNLTDNEIEIICGVFYFFADDPSINKKARVRNRSFFPIPSVWDRCGLDYGEWMPRSEGLIQDILKDYAKNDFSRFPCANNEWKPRVKGNTMWRKAYSYHEHRASEVLRSQIGETI